MSDSHPIAVLPIREDAGLPAEPACAVCGVKLAEPYGWCANCREAYCAECGTTHFCLPSCREAGCHAGLCVRLVRNGVVLPNSWGMREPVAPEAAEVDAG